MTPCVDILAVAQDLRRAADRRVSMCEMSNADRQGAAAYEDAIWERTKAGLDLIGVRNLICELGGCRPPVASSE